MHKIWVIAAREYNAAVKTKSFIVSLLVMPLMMSGSILMNKVLKNKVDITEKHFAIVDRTPGGQLFGVIQQAADERNSKHIIKGGVQVKPKFSIEKIEPSADNGQAIKQQRFELSERVRKQELFGFLEIGPEIFKIDKAAAAKLKERSLDAEDEENTDTRERAALRYQSNSPTYDAFQNWIEAVLNEAIQERRFATVNTNLKRQDLQAILMPVSIITKGLSSRNSETGEIEEGKDDNKVASVLIPGGLMFLMFMVIMVGSTPLMQGVVEEKMQRIAEVLLGSMRPFELMMGKLIGMAGVSLTLGGIYLAGAYWAANRYDLAQYLSVYVLVWFLIYQTLAVLMFGSLCIAVGAACTDLRETQIMYLPVMLLVTLPVFVWYNVVREPTSTFATWISFFPFATPVLMLGRQVVPPGIPSWQPILGVTIVILTTLFCVYAAGRVFRVGLLMQGKGARFSELAKWVFRG